jgi:hypothetical protein
MAVSDRDGDALVAQILAGANDDTASELLKAFYAGYPIDRLRLLLRSESDEAVRAGVWIASELGADAAAMAEELPTLLQHHAKYVRFFAVEAVLANASSRSGEAVGRAVSLIEDPEDAVRWKALRLLARASREQLATGLPFIPRAEVAGGLSWLLRERSLTEVIARLDGDRVERMFAVAAAARMSRGREEALRHAAASADPEVSMFAREELGAENE